MLKRLVEDMPAELPEGVALKIRAAIEAQFDAIEALVSFLDTIEGDIEEEDTADDEPWLSLPCAADASNSRKAWPNLGGDDDREADGGDGADADCEPALGSVGGCGWSSDSQEGWSAGNLADLEQDVGDESEFTWCETHGSGAHGSTCREDDAEPSLAHTNDINQERAQKHVCGIHAADDLESEHDGREPDADKTSGRALRFVRK